MAYRSLVLAASLLAMPAAAEVVQFQGHAVEVDGASDARRVVAMRSGRYSIPGSPQQVVGKVQACLGRADSGAGIVSVDAANGLLRAVSRTGYRLDGEARMLRGRWTVEAGEGGMQIAVADLAHIHDEGIDESYLPVPMRDDEGWERALAAVIEVEHALLDCMYR